MLSLLNRSAFVAIGLAIVGAGLTSSAQASDCPTIVDDRARLACFDQLHGRPDGTAPASRPLANPKPALTLPDLSVPVDRIRSSELDSLTPAGSNPVARAVLDVRRSLGTTLADRWELEPDSDRGRFLLRPYKPMYLMPLDWTSRKNELPFSPNPAGVVTNRLALRRGEAKFQVSLKTKVVEDMIGDNGDLWLGYTQTSYWQIYNSAESRPFRESNYEPEIMAVFRTDYSLLGWHGVMAGLSLNHQSNGRSEPLSRSWNRVIAQVGFDRKNWMAVIRPWWRIPESTKDDDNPDIENYMGRADLLLVRKSEGHELSFLLRHSLRSGDRSHGAVELSYAFPISSYLKAYVQLFSGYGDSLLDYNRKRTVLSMGLSLVDF